MSCLEYYCKRALLIVGFPLEEASKESFHYGNKSPFLLFFSMIWFIYGIFSLSLHYKWYQSPFQGQHAMTNAFQATKHLGKNLASLGRKVFQHI